MPLDAARIVKPMHKLHKTLAHPSRLLSPEGVHELRTGCYRVQSAMRALGFAEERRGGDLVEMLERIRKRAGKVRDADVLTSLAATMGTEGGSESLIQLIEALGIRRGGYKDKLKRTINRERGNARDELKHFRKRIEKQLAATDAGFAEGWSRNAMARSVELSYEIAEWPKLKRDNLHPFRLKVKELRVVEQLSSVPDGKLIDALRDVKNAVGEWHDWSELAELATKVLNRKGQEPISKHLRSILEDRLQHALVLSTRLRQRYFGLREGRRGADKPHPREIEGPVLSAAARLAA